MNSTTPLNLYFYRKRESLLKVVISIETGITFYRTNNKRCTREIKWRCRNVKAPIRCRAFFKTDYKGVNVISGFPIHNCSCNKHELFNVGTYQSASYTSIPSNDNYTI